MQKRNWTERAAGWRGFAPLAVSFMLAMVVLLVVALTAGGGGGRSEAQPASVSELPPPLVVGTSNMDRVCISPGKVYVDGLREGQLVGETMTVHNGSGEGTVFSVRYREPYYTSAGYYKLTPEQAASWIEIGAEEVSLEAHQYGRIRISVCVPEGGGGDWPKAFEFWVAVLDTTQGGMVQVELCTRFLVTMG